MLSIWYKNANRIPIFRDPNRQHITTVSVRLVRAMARWFRIGGSLLYACAARQCHEVLNRTVVMC